MTPSIQTYALQLSLEEFEAVLDMDENTELFATYLLRQSKP